MASDYGLNFGFRRSDESMRISEGRFRSPKTGTLLQGVVAELDPDNEGYLKVAGANPAPVSGAVGLLIQELAWDYSIYEVGHVDSFDLNKVKNDRLSVLTMGPGVKIWLKNTPAQDRGDRQIAAVTMVDLTGVVVNGGLGWDGTKYVAAGGGAATTNALATVTFVDTNAGLVEAVLNA